MPNADDILSIAKRPVNFRPPTGKCYIKKVTAKAKPRILVADDSADLLLVLRETLQHEGYIVETVPDGEEALAAIRKNPPDIAILDLKMPRRDGFEVCRALREDAETEHLPVIILSASGTRDHKVAGLNLGADDFIAKPVDTLELLARIRMILKRTKKVLDASPLTRLPGSVSIETHVEDALATGRPLAVLYLDLNQFKAYNDAYGYEAGNRVLKACAHLLLEVTRREGRGDFVGHIGGDDFIVITTPERMEPLAARIIAEFDRLVPSFYSPQDRRKGKIVAVNRQGRIEEFPFLSLAIGICHNSLRPLSTYAEVAQVGSELKSQAKKRPGSAYVVDRRRD